MKTETRSYSPCPAIPTSLDVELCIHHRQRLLIARSTWDTKDVKARTE